MMPKHNENESMNTLSMLQLCQLLIWHMGLNIHQDVLWILRLASLEILHLLCALWTEAGRGREEDTVTCNASRHETGDVGRDQSPDATVGDVSPPLGSYGRWRHSNMWGEKQETWAELNSSWLLSKEQKRLYYFIVKQFITF